MDRDGLMSSEQLITSHYMFQARDTNKLNPRFLSIHP